MKLSEAHSILECKQSMMTTYRYLFTPDEISANGIAIDVLTNGIGLPSRIMFFRNQYFHDPSWSIPEFTTDNVYFSSSKWVNPQ